MSILTRYIAATFAKHLIYTGTALVALVLVANFFGGLERVFSSWDALIAFLDASLRSIPFVAEQMQPMMVLLAAMFTFSGLSRNGELTAMKVAGAGPWRLLRPFLFVLVPVVALAYLNQNYLHAALNPPRDQESAAEPANHVWRGIGDTIFYIDHLDRGSLTASGIRSFRLSGEPLRIANYDWMERATRTPGGWRLERILRRELDASEQFRFSASALEEQSRQEFPNVFRPTIIDPRHMPFGRLRQEIQRLENEGHRVAVYLLEWYQKSAVLFALGVMAVIGMALVQSSPRRGRVGVEASMTVLLGVMFWLVSEISILLGKGEQIPPLAAAWGPGLLFAAIALVLYRRMF